MVSNFNFQKTVGLQNRMNEAIEMKANPTTQSSDGTSSQRLSSRPNTITYLSLFNHFINDPNGPPRSRLPNHTLTATLSRFEGVIQSESANVGMSPDSFEAGQFLSFIVGTCYLDGHCIMDG